MYICVCSSVKKLCILSRNAFEVKIFSDLLKGSNICCSLFN